MPQSAPVGSTSSPDSIETFYSNRPEYEPAEHLRRFRLQVRDRGRAYYVLKELVARFQGVPIGVALDIGGRDGSMLTLLAEQLDIRRKVATDLQPLERIQDGVEFQRLDATRMADAFPSDSVDLVLLLEVIEHVVNPDAVVREIRRVLRPGGVFLLTTPNLSALTNRLALLAGYLPPCLEVSTERQFGRPFVDRRLMAGHLRVFTYEALRQFITYHGFRIDRLYTAPTHEYVDEVPGARNTTALRSSGGGQSVRGLLRAYNLLERVSVRLSPALGSQIVLVASKV